MARRLTKAEIRRIAQPLGRPLLIGMEVDNLRGFRRMRLDLSRDLILFVGPNNSGKTSIFRLLDWLLNYASAETLSGEVDVSVAEQQLLVPARNTRGGARRIVLLVRILDGRRRPRFYADEGIARLRFRLRGDRIYTNVRPPTRSEPLDTEPQAMELLHELRESTYFRHVPASRDVSSRRFQATLSTALEARLTKRAVHQARAGAPGEYREVARALRALKEVAERLAEPLWTEMQTELIPSLSRDASLKLAVDTHHLVKWMAEHIELKLVTGDHDLNSVFPIEVGSGLQSLLDLAMFRGEAIPEGRDAILAIEEPEAFLHPTAQRTLARRLAADDSVKRLISTHSATFVEEASYQNIVLVRNHIVYQPRHSGPSAADRTLINSALLAGQGAEMAFSRGVLLVEGEGDKLFFETLRRRLATYDQTGSLDELSIVWVGSNARFAPWMRLLESYISDNVRPIEWLVLADGADSSAEILKALRLGRISFPGEVTLGLDLVRQTSEAGDEGALLRVTRAANRLARRTNTRVALLPIDLEFSAVVDASDQTLRRIATRIGVDSSSKEEFLRRVGSKYGAGPSANPLKAPWTRAVMAEELPWDELSPDVRDVLARWFRTVLGDSRRVNEVFRAAGIKVSQRGA